MSDSNAQTQITTVKISNADPSALGTFGLSMVTLVASSQKLGITTGLSMVIPWAIFLGALAQLFACINDSKRNNVFGTTVFGAFAFFWMAVAASWLIKLGAFGPALQVDMDLHQLAFGFLGYLVFCLAMTVPAAAISKVMLLIFIFVDLLLFGLTLSTFGIWAEVTHKIGAVSELLIAIVGFYAVAASVINAQFGKVILPLGKPLIGPNK